MKPVKTTVLGVDFDAVTPKEAAARAVGFLNGGRPRHSVTANPERVMKARKNAEYAAVISKADLTLPDGVGIALASRLNAVKLKSRVTGADLCASLFDYMKDAGKTVYFLGGRPGVALKAKEAVERRYPGLRVVGLNDGYFSKEREKLILEEIRSLKPDLLLAGLGAPKQEMWIARFKDELPCKALIGVGGCLDVFAGLVPRAPEAFRKLGLEWLYRIVRQPSRIRRSLAIPAFIAGVAAEKIGRLIKPRKN
jgi:N-acetylglucosaminyldiphosphoundecaprenol N-acetyl-beta-D-mannosaminyltransferase